MGSLGWAVALSVLSAASYAAAAVAQERLAGHGQRGLSRWVVALSLTGSGVGLHVLALNFGTVAVVQALGTLTLLFALPISALRYRRRISRAAWVDAVLTVVGLAVIMSLSVESDGPALLSDTTGRYLALIAVLLVAVLAGAAWLSTPRWRGVLLAAAAGSAFGISSVMSKAVMTAFTEGGLGRVSLLVGGMVVVLGVGGYVLGQLSYRGAGLAAPLATVSVSNPVVAAIAGVVVFDEGFRYSPGSLIIVAVAAGVMTAGVIGLARRTTGPTDQPTDGAAPGPAAGEPRAKTDKRRRAGDPGPAHEPSASHEATVAADAPVPRQTPQEHRHPDGPVARAGGAG